jgi:hypothetical protein
MLIIKHTDHCTFVDYYYPQDINIDMQQTIYSIDLDVKLIRAISQHSQ